MPPDSGRVRRGDFVVPEDDLEEAEEAFSERGRRSRALDKSTRAPVVTNVDLWKTFQSGLDYPGVDTPTDEPRQALTDEPLPGGEGVIDPEPETDFVDEATAEVNAQADAMGDVLFPD